METCGGLGTDARSCKIDLRGLSDLPKPNHPGTAVALVSGET